MLVKLAPSRAGALFFRASIYSELDEFDKAKEDYLKLLSLEPKNNNVKLGLALLYKKEGKYNESLTLLTLLIEDNPNTAEYYIARSNVERLTGHTELALMDVEKAIELEPDNGNHYTLQAILLERLGKKEAAKQSRFKAARLKSI
jgi:superkiller protein 3